jgi:hypothetical protein
MERAAAMWAASNQDDFDTARAAAVVRMLASGWGVTKRYRLLLLLR